MPSHAARSSAACCTPTDGHRARSGGISAMAYTFGFHIAPADDAVLLSAVYDWYHSPRLQCFLHKES